MKKLYTVFVMLLCSVVAFGQVTDVLTGLNTPTDVLVDGDYLYYGLSGGSAVYKINLTDATPTPTLVANIGTSVFGLAINGTDLYVSANGQSKIVKVDLTDSSQTVTDFVTGITSPIGLAVDGNYLYIASRGDDKVYKADMTSMTPTAMEVATGIDANDVVIKGNDLYASNDDGAVHKIDLTTGTNIQIITGLPNCYGMWMIGNDLYVSNFFDDKIVQIDVTAVTPTAVDFVTGPDGPLGIGFDGNFMYFAEINSGKISKATVFPVSTTPRNPNPEWTLFPNPAQDMIRFEGLNKTQSYVITDMTGRVVLQGMVYPTEPLSIERLTTGIYVIQMENGDVTKFMKR